MSCIRKVSLIINCGYARTCIYENSGTANDTAMNFRSRFSAYPEYGFPEGYFEAKGKENFSQFDRDSSKILTSFKSKFRTDIGLDRSSYLSTFSLKKWLELPAVEKKRHTLSNCTRCFEMHEQQQRSFPLKPFFQPEPVVSVDQAAMQRQGIKQCT